MRCEDGFWSVCLTSHFSENYITKRKKKKKTYATFLERIEGDNTQDFSSYFEIVKKVPPTHT